MGVYAKTDKEIRKAMSYLVKNKKLNKKEGERLVNDVVREAKKLEWKIENQARRISLDVIRELKLATHRDLNALEKKLKKLKR